tara:strand:- start:3 stop:332 length:330 start_codon:yes stop_codon:yes gene_type:complete
MTNAVPIDDAAALTRHIESRYHARHRAQLSQLVLLAEMIEDLHQGNEGNPEGLSEILRHMSAKMDVQIKEEVNRPGFTGGQNSRRIARYGTDTKEEDIEAVFTHRLTVH